MPGEIAVQAAGDGPGGVPFGPGARTGAQPADLGPESLSASEQQPDSDSGTGRLALRGLASVDDALLAARTKLAVAETRLAESHDEAQSIISDAVEQASLISARADQDAQELLGESHQQAAELTAAAEAAAAKLRREADLMMADAETGSRRLRERMTDDLAQQLATHEATLQAGLAAHEVHLARTSAETEELVARQQAQAKAAAETVRQSATRELENSRLDAVTSRSEAAAEARYVLETARADAAREIAAAADQTKWTQQIIVGLLEAADLDAQRVRRSTRVESAAAIRRTHGRLAQILATARLRVGARQSAAEREAQVMGREAAATLDRAAVDAIQIREEAAADARRIVGEAQDTAAARLDRAERRLLEAESGARAVREQVAAELAKAQREIHELRRAAKAEEAEAIGAARTEADAVRTSSRRLLAEAKAELAALSAQRDAIAGELGSLSGVIDALAVSDAPESARAKELDREPPPQPVVAERDTAARPNRPLSHSAEPVTGEIPRITSEHDQPTSLLDEMKRSE
ncbi:MAG: hypothetical protein DLM58_22375 [Pseudonocardiales bacterium]|nr:MAG: hypothetical protein DLM58_22375 [Pseudonocardiales bacterium]